MDEKRYKYILLNDRVGEHIEKGLLSLSLTQKTVPSQFLRGEILEALLEADQPEDPGKIALTGITRKSRLECPTSDVARLTEEDADLLSAIASAEERHRIYRERNRLDSGRNMVVGNKVFVKVKGVHKDVSGVIWFRGSLPTNTGTMFGVELVSKEGLGQGTTDGMFRNQRFFTCPVDCGVFVALDKIRVQEESDTTKSPKKEDPASQKSTFSTKVKNYLFNAPKGTGLDSNGTPINYPLKIDQRVVTFLEDKEVRGFVRYIADKPDALGVVAVGIELDTRAGRGTGLFQRHQKFVCKKDFAIFASADTVIPEEDFDAKPDLDHRPLKSDKFSIGDEYMAASLGYGVNERKSSSNRGIRRSNSISSMSTSSCEEAYKFVGSGSCSDKEKVVKEQEDILAKIKAGQTTNSINPEQDMNDIRQKQVSQDSQEGINFHEEHFNRTARLNADSPRLIQSGKSNFFVPSVASSSARRSDIRQPVAPPMADSHYGLEKPVVLSRGSMKSPTSSKESSPIHRPGGLHGTHDNTNYYSHLPISGYGREHELVTDCESGEIQNKIFNTKEQDDHRTSPNPTEEQLDHVTGTGIDSSAMDFPLDLGLEVGSMVEIPLQVGNEPRYGVIRWIGYLPELKDKLVAGLELEEEQSACSDGVFNGKRYFTCPAGRGFFVLLQHCRRDSRFQPDSPMDIGNRSGKNFGSLESPFVGGIVPPPSFLARHDVGRMKGIQGHHNSCYLDCTLYSMFAFTTAFDTLLHRAKTENDLEEYETVQEVLKDEIVNPLRRNGFVRADRVLKLRRLLDKLGSTSGLTNEEKDPEEFLNTLLQQVMKAEPLLQLKSNLGTGIAGLHGNRCEVSNYYQIITDKDETIKLASVQKLLEQSFLSADLKLAEVPSCLILQMPRFGNKYKMYDIILPDLTLDVTDILENVPRRCSMCGKKASSFECKDCYQEKTIPDGITSFCKECSATVHSHPNRPSHKLKPIVVPREYSQYASQDSALDIQKYTMELFAVVCIATSHYVAFVKCGTGPDAPWCFFDSMSDRKGESNGYNIPAVSECPEATKWLSAKPEEIISAKDRGELPSRIKRLFGDAYMCMYQNLDLTMYK